MLLTRQEVTGTFKLQIPQVKGAAADADQSPGGTVASGGVWTVLGMSLLELL